MGSLWDDFGDDVTVAYNDGIKPAATGAYNLAKNNFNRLNGVADAAAGAATNLLDFLGGNSNILVYLGIGLVAVIVLPELIEKAI